jgi:hypothetical protein
MAATVVALGWVRWYCRLVGTEAAERRRAEIESDVWEQRADARERGVRPWAVAASIARRVTGGVPDDLLWVRTQRLAMRGQQADRKAADMKSLGHPAAQWWWVLGAALLAAVFLWIGIDNLVGEAAPLPEAAAQCFAYLALLVVGIVLRVKAPRTSAVLITAGAVPGFVAWWSWPILVLAAIVVVGALIEVIHTSAHGVMARLAAAVGAVLLGVAGIIPAMGLPFVFALPVAAAVAAAGIVLVVVTRSREARVPSTPVAAA